MTAIDKKFFHAIEQRDPDAVKTSLGQGANVFAIRNGDTPLHLAACCIEERIQILVLNQMKAMKKDIYVYINARDSKGNTPLIKAAKHGRIHNLRLLLEHSATIDLTNHKNKKALDYAIRKGYQECEALLRSYQSRFLNLSFEKQMKLAIDAHDPKLVQILLGSKFCQLWQHWFAHLIIYYQMLSVEADINCDLFLEIIQAQKQILAQSLQLLETRKT